VAKFGVTVDTRAMQKMAESVSPGSATLRRVREMMEEEAERIRAEGAAAWPRTYTTRGDPASDEWYRKVARKKGHNIPIPSSESFYVETRVSSGKLETVVFSTADWAYAIRSRQIGETETERRERFEWNKGQSEESYKSQKQLGAKRHAWSVLMVRPFKKAQRQLGARLIDVIAGGM
jgi:hypothetical protein